MAKKNTRKPTGTKKQITSPKKKIMIWALKLFIASIVAGLIFISLVYIGLFGKLPSYSEISNIRNHSASVVYSSDGVLIGKYYIQDRLTTDIDKISANVKNALVATEDSRFFDHKGLDIISLGRVFFKTIILRDLKQGGGSTISQQLAKNLYPRRSTGLLAYPANKTREIFIASRIEKTYTKDEVLGLYLNSVPFGENIYGIEVASQRFFNKSSSALTIPEAATLVGMLAANTAYNPRINPERSLLRRNIVLDRMHAHGLISLEEADKFKSVPIKTTYTLLDHNHGPAPYFMEQVRIQVEAILKKDYDNTYNIYTDGLKITTTLDATLQNYATKAVKTHMQNLQKAFNEHWLQQEPWQNNQSIFTSALKRTSRYIALQEKGLSESKILEELNKPVNTTIFNHEGEKRISISPIDSLKQTLKTLHTGFVAMNPENGYVLAWEGGVNFRYFKYDHITSKRQSGSTFKPIVYATAIDKGYSPCEYISNEQRIYKRYNNWSPSNADGNHSGFYSIKGGLVHSSNTIAAELINKTGVSDVILMAQKMGIKSDMPNLPSIALGTSDMSLLELVTAYTAFANYGRAVEPVILLKIEDAAGKILYEFETPTFHESAFHEETARIMNQILQEAIESGTGSALYSTYNLKGNYAGKTGTTQNNSDGWFIGYTPTIVAGAWVGAENPGIHFRTTALGQGARTALPIFARFMQQAEKSPKHSHIAAKRFYPLPFELEILMDCENHVDYIETEEEERGFFQRIFQKSEQSETEITPDDSEDKNLNLLQKMKGIFKKNKEE